jgi:hypothetical protein
VESRYSDLVGYVTAFRRTTLSALDGRSLRRTGCRKSENRTSQRAKVKRGGYDAVGWPTASSGGQANEVPQEFIGFV